MPKQLVSMKYLNLLRPSTLKTIAASKAVEQRKPDKTEIVGRGRKRDFTETVGELREMAEAKPAEERR